MAERKTFLLRVRRELWDEIERLAAEEFRSVNAQVEYLLREALARRGRSPRSETPPAASQDAGVKLGE
ncbi:MAG: hypothetical protein QHJ73_19815 [Armatimonadota bacterium]|jgi:hypothetical protein|nr:hypothetical protein [Armatimonadota bacterium]